MRPPSEFGADITNQANNEATVSPAMMICTRLAGRAIIRVVGRCNDAQENCDLGKRANVRPRNLVKVRFSEPVRELACSVTVAINGN